jgi:hypothetical protein
MYDGAANASAALDLMEATYASDSWHYTDPVSGETPDLHHFMAFRSAIVGIASVGGICDSQTGYGVSWVPHINLTSDGILLIFFVILFYYEIGHRRNDRLTVKY